MATVVMDMENEEEEGGSRWPGESSLEREGEATLRARDGSGCVLVLRFPASLQGRDLDKSASMDRHLESALVAGSGQDPTGCSDAAQGCVAVEFEWWTIGDDCLRDGDNARRPVRLIGEKRRGASPTLCVIGESVRSDGCTTMDSGEDATGRLCQVKEGSP